MGREAGSSPRDAVHAARQTDRSAGLASKCRLAHSSIGVLSGHAVNFSRKMHTTVRYCVRPAAYRSVSLSCMHRGAGMERPARDLLQTVPPCLALQCTQDGLVRFPTPL